MYKRMLVFFVCLGVALATGCCRQPGQDGGSVDSAKSADSQVGPAEAANPRMLAVFSRGRWGRTGGVIDRNNRIVVNPEYDSVSVIGNFIVLGKYDRIGLAYRDGRILAPCVYSWGRVGEYEYWWDFGSWGASMYSTDRATDLPFAVLSTWSPGAGKWEGVAFKADGTPLLGEGYKARELIGTKFVGAIRTSDGKLRAFDGDGNDVGGHDFDDYVGTVPSFETLFSMNRRKIENYDSPYDSRPVSPLFVVMRSEGRLFLYDADFKRKAEFEVDGVGCLADGLLPVKCGKLWGFIDLAGKVVIQPKFARVYGFQDGLCPAAVDSGSGQDKEDEDGRRDALRWGFIDRTGEFAIPPKFASVRAFEEGFASVTEPGENGQRGPGYFIDRTGARRDDYDKDKKTIREICPGVTLSPMNLLTWDGGKKTAENVQYAYVEKSSGLVVFSSGGKEGLLNSQSGSISDARYRDFKRWSDQVLIARCDDGEVLFDFSGARVEGIFGDIGDLSEGLAQYLPNDSGLWGYLDDNGRIAIAPKFKKVGDFSESRAPVEDGKLWGFIDRTGAWAIEPKYTDTGSFHEGLAQVETDDRWGAIDADGKMVIPAQYDSLGSFRGGIAAVGIECPEGYLDEKGRPAIEAQFDYAADFEDGYAIVRAGESSGVIDLGGKFVVPLQDGYLQYCGDGAFHRRDSHSHLENGLLKTSGERIACRMSPCFLARFFAGLLAAYGPSGYKSGFIDAAGRWVVVPKYSEVRGFREGLAAVEQYEHGTTWGFVDREGREVVKPRYGDVGDFSEGLARVHQGYRWGFVDKMGREVIAPKYTGASDFRGGRALVRRYVPVPPGSGDPDSPFPPPREVEACFWIDTQGNETKGETILLGDPMPNGYIARKQDGNKRVSYWEAEKKGGSFGTWDHPDQRKYIYGVVDFAGNWIVEPTFDDLKSPGGKYPMIGFRDGKNCYVDQQGLALFLDASDLGEYHGGIAVCLFPGVGYRAIDLSGRIVFETDFWLSDFCEPFLAPVGKPTEGDNMR
ncbi:MAG: WG repeat-containing protein [Candidatus Brocadiia bacterium]